MCAVMASTTGVALSVLTGRIRPDGKVLFVNPMKKLTVTWVNVPTAAGGASTAAATKLSNPVFIAVTAAGVQRCASVFCEFDVPGRYMRAWPPLKRREMRCSTTIAAPLGLAVVTTLPAPEALWVTCGAVLDVRSVATAPVMLNELLSKLRMFVLKALTRVVVTVPRSDVDIAPLYWKYQ
jgi:hypothetical protein